MENRDWNTLIPEVERLKEERGLYFRWGQFKSDEGAGEIYSGEYFCQVATDYEMDMVLVDSTGNGTLLEAVTNAISELTREIGAWDDADGICIPDSRGMNYMDNEGEYVLLLTKDDVYRAKVWEDTENHRRPYVLVNHDVVYLDRIGRVRCTADIFERKLNESLN